jgi:hypothetical protein
MSDTQVIQDIPAASARPCIVLLRENDDGDIEIHYGEPTKVRIVKRDDKFAGYALLEILRDPTNPDMQTEGGDPPPQVAIKEAVVELMQTVMPPEWMRYVPAAAGVGVTLVNSMMARREQVERLRVRNPDGTEVRRPRRPVIAAKPRVRR